MTTSPTDSDSLDAAPQSPTRQAAECEAGVRRVLAYISKKRYRRWMTGAAVFLLLYMVIGIVASIPFTLGTPLLPIIGRDGLLETIYSRPLIFGLWVLVTDLLLPLAITVFIFRRLLKIYRGY